MPTLALCPACVHRFALLIGPFCPVCHGTGLLTLHPHALTLAEPEDITRAVTVHIEGVARSIEERTTLSDDRAGMVDTAMRELESARIICQRPPLPTLEDETAAGTARPL